MSQDRHPTEDLPAYALGALDKDEREVIASHVETCETCARDLSQFEEALFEAAAIGAINVDPPTDLRTRIVLRHRGASVPSTTSWGDRVIEFLRSPVPAAVPIGLAILLVLAFGVVGASRQQADTYARALAGVADGQWSRSRQQAQIRTRAAVVIPSQGSPYLIVRLPAPGRKSVGSVGPEGGNIRPCRAPGGYRRAWRCVHVVADRATWRRRRRCHHTGASIGVGPTHYATSACRREDLTAAGAR